MEQQSARSVDSEFLEILLKIVESQFPCSVLLDDQGHIVHAFGEVHRYFKLRPGRPSLEVLDLLPRCWHTSIRALIDQVLRNESPNAQSSASVQSSEDPSATIRATARRIAAPAPRPPFILLSLEEHGAAHDVLAYATATLTDDAHGRGTKQRASSRPQPQPEVANNILELQAINTQLLAINSDLRQKIADLTELTHDMDNLLLSTDVHTIFLDEHLCIRKFTPRMGELFHLMPEDIGRRIEDFMHQIRFEGLQQKLKDVLHNGVAFQLEVESVVGDHFLMRILPYQGEMVRKGVVVTLIDITELKKAESRFCNAIEASPSGMLLIGPEGNIALINSVCEAIFGYERDELIGRPLECLVPERLRAEHIRHRNNYFASPRIRGMSLGLDVWGLRKDGSEIPLDIRLSPIESSDGLSVLASVIDMTRSKMLESSLRAQVHQRDRFLAMLSHELRNPMAAIVSAATLLSRTSMQLEAKEPSDIILRQAAQMTTLLDDLLDVSRVTQGKIKLRVEPIDLRDICRESLETMESLIAAHRHQVQLFLPDVPVVADVDRGRMLQIVENLLTNAIKYTPDAGSIQLELLHKDRRAWIRITDNGRGIAHELLDAIFDMFVQSDSTLEHSDGGMGVGLTLVRALVELHHGSVHAASEGVGKGSTFTVELPTIDKAPIGIATSLPPNTWPSLRIALVEDNRDARMMLESLLSMDGYEVHSAANGIQGLAMILDRNPNLAVIDIGLPGMDGYEIARRIRQAGNHTIELVALTGYGRDEDRAAVLEAGFNHHLVKPVRIEELERILQSVQRSTPTA